MKAAGQRCITPALTQWYLCKEKGGCSCICLLQGPGTEGLQVKSGLSEYKSCHTCTRGSHPHPPRLPGQGSSPPPGCAPPALPAVRSSQLGSCSSSTMTGRSSQPAPNPALSMKGKRGDSDLTLCVLEEPTGLSVRWACPEKVGELTVHHPGTRGLIESNNLGHTCAGATQVKLMRARYMEGGASVI